MYFAKFLDGLGDSLPDGAFETTGECPSGYSTVQGSKCIRRSSRVAELARCTEYNKICVPIPRAIPSPSPANVTVTVSPQIQTEVSPQISPVFQQQYQPTNSPATAGTSQTSAPPAGPIGVNSTSMQPIAPAQLPQAPAPSYTAPSYAAAPVSYTPPAQADQLPPSPLPTATPPPAAPQVSTATAAPVFDWKIAAIIGAGLFGAMAFSKRK